MMVRCARPIVSAAAAPSQPTARRGAPLAGNKLLLAAAPLLFGCSWLVEVGDDQCTRDRDCSAIGLSGTCEQGVCVARSPATEAPGPDDQRDAATPEIDAATSGGSNSCLGSMRCEDDDVCFKEQCVPMRDVERFLCEEQEPPRIDELRFQMHVKEFVSQTPAAGLTASACVANDVSCNNPVATFEDTEGTGDIVIDLPYEFAGFLQVRSDDTLPALWYFTRPLIEPRVANDLEVPSPTTVQLLAAVTQLTPDASKGLVILEAFDCAGVAVPGVSFAESKKSAIPFFIVDDLPNLESTVTVRNDEANQAVGGFLNATPGFTLFTARIGVEGTKLGEYNALVRANTVTYLDIYP
jgi:hypothetical protein